MSNKILITGNRGFLGTNIQKELEKLGNQVIGFDIKNDFAEDIRNKDYLDKVFEENKPDIVIHFAARPGVRKSAIVPEEYITTNIIGTLNVLECCKKHKAKKALVASSSSIYGEQPDCLLKEEMVCENPKSIYAMTKKSVETLCKLYSSDMKVYVFRPFSVYGENGRPDMAIGQLLNIYKKGGVFEKYGNGNSVRTYTNVHDFVDCLIKLMYYDSINNYEVFNIGGAEKISLNHLLKIIMNIFPLRIKEMPFNELDVTSSCADISKSKQVLNWEPVRNFEEEIIKIFKNNE